MLLFLLPAPPPFAVRTRTVPARLAASAVAVRSRRVPARVAVRKGKRRVR
jgi:hypothetical protein